MLRCILFFILISGSTQSQSSSVSGSLKTGEVPLEGVSIHVEETSIGTISNKDGYFIIKNLNSGTYIIAFSAVGYTTARRSIHLQEEQDLVLNVTLEPAVGALEEIVIRSATGLNRKTPYNIQSISIKGIENTGKPGGLMGVLKEVPGVYGAEFGLGISKPVLRGLGFSRVVSIYQGNKLENHQWGADHGLGITDLGIKKVEVIKGPASVLYGSGALGGVLVSIDDEDLLFSENFTGSLGNTYNSVSQGFRTTATAGKKFKNSIYFSTALAYEDHADYKSGGERIIGNSRFKVFTTRFHTGIEKDKFKNKVSFTYNSQLLGIIDDGEMLPGNSLATHRGDREQQLPYQKVNDLLFSYSQSTTGENFETYLHLSHHYNGREEIETAPDLVDLGLRQNHSFLNARLQKSKNKFTHSLGLQGSYLSNKNYHHALEILIPNSSFTEGGLFYLADLEANSWFFQAAVRYDLRKVEMAPGEEEENTLSTRHFDGFTGSLGLTKNFTPGHQLKVNLSGGYRAPDLAELFSNGQHPGTNRFEIGNPSFEREQSLQADVNYSFKSNRFKFQISLFTSRMFNYIYFEGTGEEQENTNLEIWRYHQAGALFKGLEWEAGYFIVPERLEINATAAAVRATKKSTGENLGFIPPDNFNIKLSYLCLGKTLNLATRTRIVAHQDRPGKYEEVTEGYVLQSLTLTKNWYTGSNQFETSLSLNNIFDKKYVDHLSLLKAFDIPAPGRNLSLNFRWHF